MPDGPSNPFVRVTIDRERLIDEMVAYLNDPSAARNQREVIRALDDLHPESVDVLEAMLLDGTEERDDVAAYVEAVFP
ncbi:MAG: hypothetical protein ACR2J8_04605 [Thermomicrobiales bacterium]